ncbi:MAG: tetratricopeptide repeat protein [Alphaproteobacteria bacterium]
MKKIIITTFIFILTLVTGQVESQEVDIDELLERLTRIEKNISDLQKGKVEELEKSISSGYISRNEARFDDIETKNRMNYGIIEEIQNKINNLEKKLDLINSDFQSRVSKIENKLDNMEDSQKTGLIKKNPVIQPALKEDLEQIDEKISENISESEIKKKYENAIKLLWASKYKEAESELKALKKINPLDLMPNIQYWLGEVHYAQKNFEKAIIEFGDGLKNYPDSIKGPDNLLKLGLSFSNLKKINEACNVLYQLGETYNDAPKNVLEKANSEMKKLNCQE